MSLYQGDQIGLLIALIEEANPNLPFKLTPDNCRFGTPVAQTPPAGTIWDTRINVIPKKNSNYTGPMTVQYRRLDIASLMRGITLSVDSYVSAATLPFFTLVAALNDKYGLALNAADFSATGMSVGTSTFNVLGSSLTYKGQLRVTWAKGKQLLSEIAPPGALPGILFFSNNEANPSPVKPVGELTVYGVDFTPQSSSMAAVANAAALTSTSPLGVALSTFNRTYGANLSLEDAGTVVGGLGGLVATRFSLPNASIPEANAKYKYAIAVAAKETSWFTGRMIFHYN